MGAELVKLTTDETFRDCTVDADCYAASTTPVYEAITTDEGKARACCLYYGVKRLPFGTTEEVAAGTVWLDGFAKLGLPDKI